MSVQRDFIEAYAARWGCEEKYASGLLDHVLEEHAHELAEKVRRQQAPSDADQRFVAYVNGWRDGRNEAADLIDPEVE